MAHRLPNARDYGLLLTLAAIWGSSFAFIKVGVAEVPPVTLTAVRLVLAAMFMAGVMMMRGSSLPTAKSAWVMMAVSALIGNALPFALIAWGQQGIPSATSAILMGIMPLITMMVAHAFTKDEKVNTRKAAGMATGFIGLIVFTVVLITAVTVGLYLIPYVEVARVLLFVSSRFRFVSSHLP